MLAANPKEVKAYRKGGDLITLSGDALKFANRMLDEKARRTSASAAAQ